MRVMWALALTALLLCTAGCQQVRRMAGIHTTVEAPEAGSPEAVVFDALAAALDPNEPKGWKSFKALLHSDQLASPISEKTWRTMNFSALRRKARLYLEDDALPTYKLAYTEDMAPAGLKLFIFNEKSEVPTPCTVHPDPQHNNAWRISMCSL